jgi:DNA-binding ferritin-like protein (oxidative damage protectant)
MRRLGRARNHPDGLVDFVWRMICTPIGHSTSKGDVMAKRAFARTRPPAVESQPRLHQHSREVQAFDQLRDMPIGLSAEIRAEIAQLVNKVLADTRILHDLYKKTHWLMRGRTFYQLHLLMDKHAEEQEALVDLMAERVQTLGAVAVGDPRHVAELTSIPRPPDGVEEVPAMLSRLLEAHELIIVESREAAARADELDDDSTNDILVSDVLRTNELQAWFVAEHLVDTPTVIARV